MRLAFDERKLLDRIPICLLYAVFAVVSLLTTNAFTDDFVFRVKNKGIEYKCEQNGDFTESKFFKESVLLLRIIDGKIESRAIAFENEKGATVYEIATLFDNFLINEQAGTAFASSFSRSLFSERAILCIGKVAKIRAGRDYTLFKTLKGANIWLYKNENGAVVSAGLAKIKLDFDRNITKLLNQKQSETLDSALNELKTLVAPGATDISPEAKPDTVVLLAKFAKEQNALEFAPLENDQSVDGAELRLNDISSPPKNGQAKIISKDMISYKANAFQTFTGDIFSYRAMTSAGAVASAQISIIPEPPVAKDDMFINVKNRTAQIFPLENDSDPWAEDNSGMEVVAVEAPKNGTAEFSGKTIFYAPNSGFIGTDTFKYRARSVSGSEAEGSITVLTDMPTAVNDKAYTLINNPIPIRPLENDSDPCGMQIKLLSFGEAKFGALQLLDEDTILYNPATDFKGADSFEYRIGNGHGAEATAIINVYVGGDPVAHDDYAYAPADTQILIPVISNDSDIPGAEPYVAGLEPPKHGSASLDGNKIIYTPANGWCGLDSFSYILSNIFGGKATANVFVAVDKFEAANDNVKTKANKPVSFEPLANDSSACGLEIKLVKHSSPKSGQLEVSGNTFTYTPQKDFSGSDSFTYDASNGYETKTAAVSIFVGEQPPPSSWLADGDFAEDNFGYSANFAGDVNGDGYNDFIVSAPHWNGTGYVKLYYGSELGAQNDATWKFEVSQKGAFPGFISGGGDINNDGFADFAVGMPLFDTQSQDGGKALIFHGGASGPSPSPKTTLECNIEGARFGRSLCIDGDINGDGFSDLAVGAPNYSNGEQMEGKVFVYYGSSSGLSSNPVWTQEGNLANAQFGFSVAFADMNNDGFDDLVVGSKGYSNGEDSDGAAFVFLGSKNGLAKNYSWKTESNVAGAEYGSCVSSLGDIDKNGFEDIGIGAWTYSISIATQGAAYIYKSSSLGLSQIPDNLLEGSVAGGLFGYCISGAGDVNGDGFCDIIIGAPAGKDFLGRAYLYKGTASGIEENPFWTKTGDAYGDFGYSAKFAGDLNSDGYADIIITAPFYKGANGSNCGRAYIFYGNYDIK